jgi:hypothetical protein
MRQIERSMLPEVFDAVWKEYLGSLDHLQQGIALRAQPNLPRPRRHRRSLLPPLEPPDRTALAHHVHRIARLGS